MSNPFHDESVRLTAERARRLREAMGAYTTRIGFDPFAGHGGFRFGPHLGQPSDHNPGDAHLHGFNSRRYEDAVIYEEAGDPALAPTYDDASTKVHVITTLPGWRTRRG